MYTAIYLFKNTSVDFSLFSFIDIELFIFATVSKKQIQLKFTQVAVVFYIWVKVMFYFSYLKINKGSVKVSFLPHNIQKTEILNK